MQNYLGITIMIGAEMVSRHIRNGVELDPIDINRNYDFNFQQLNIIPSVQILPVSALILSVALKHPHNHMHCNQQHYTKQLRPYKLYACMHAYVHM